jgi:serine/threonine-protein kinase HipA
LTFSYNDNLNRITPHFLSINGKNLKINLEDILHLAKEYTIKNAKKIINDINQSLLNWPMIAGQLGIKKETSNYIESKLKTTVYKVK